MDEQKPSTAPEMKPCPYCGKMTSAQANFCWWCARELTARPERPECSTSARPIHIPLWIWIALGVVVVAGVILILILH